MHHMLIMSNNKITIYGCQQLDVVSDFVKVSKVERQVLKLKKKMAELGGAFESCVLPQRPVLLVWHR
jgi:hypothetical protein